MHASGQWTIRAIKGCLAPSMPPSVLYRPIPTIANQPKALTTENQREQPVNGVAQDIWRIIQGVFFQVASSVQYQNEKKDNGPARGAVL